MKSGVGAAALGGMVVAGPTLQSARGREPGTGLGVRGARPPDPSRSTSGRP